MPLYEYECPDCGVFERMQKFSDPVLTVCPTCQKPVEKLLSAPAIQFKGTGWYVTDYANKGSGKDKDKDKDKGEAKAKDDGAKNDGAKNDSGSKTETKKKDSSPKPSKSKP